MSYVEDSASLTIQCPDTNDSSSYMCCASNKLGSVDTEACLTVHGKYHIDMISCKQLFKA